MPQICLYLHMHQPYRLKEFSLEELGHEKGYFTAESDLNREIVKFFLGTKLVGFPGLSFFMFAVTHAAVHSGWIFLQSEACR